MSDREPLARLRELGLELPEAGTGARAARRAARQGGRPLQAPQVAETGPTRGWMVVFSSLLTLAVVAGAALTWVGVETVRDSTAGRRLATTDPTEPGFEGFLEPTPTLLVLHEREGSLVSLTLLSLGSQDAGGSVLVIPPATRVEREDYSGPLSVAYAFGGGVDAMFSLVEELLGIGITERLVVDDDRWAQLTAPVGPLQIDNDDAVPGFEPGQIDLPPERVSEWLAAKAEGDSELARAFRVQLFWEAWLEAVQQANDPAAVPGEIESGIGRFVRGLSAGAREAATLPVVEEPAAEGVTLKIDPDPAAALVARLVPFPRGYVEGARTRVRLLDGTGTPDHALSAAPLIVPAGAEIVIVGNAEAFETPRETEVRYHDPSQEQAAIRLREALGAGKVVEDGRQVDSFDVTIVLGSDV